MKQLTWRLYRPEDKPYVLALHVEMEAALKRTLDLPDLAEEPVLSALVGEVESKIVQCLFLEAEVEICAVSRYPLSARAVRAADAILTRAAQRYQIRIVRAFVPRQALTPSGRRRRRAAVRRILEQAGFTAENSTVRQFFRFIEPAIKPGAAA